MTGQILKVYSEMIGINLTYSNLITNAFWREAFIY